MNVVSFRGTGDTRALPTERYVSRLEIAEIMGVSPRTIDRWCGEGLPHETWGMRTKKFRASEVVEWARNRARRAS